MCDQNLCEWWWDDAATLCPTRSVRCYLFKTSMCDPVQFSLKAICRHLTLHFLSILNFETISQAHGTVAEWKEGHVSFVKCAVAAAVCGRGNNPGSVWGADSRKMYVMSPHFQTVVYPASIADKHKAPRALIWGCHSCPCNAVFHQEMWETHFNPSRPFYWL